MNSARHLVVVAEGEPDACDALADDLRAAFAVRTAYDEASLRASVDEEVDVVLLDRSIEGVDPADLAADLHGRGLHCQVGLLAAGRAPDVPEAIDAVVDETAPVAELERVVARMAARATYRRNLERLYDLATRRAGLAARPESALDDSERSELDQLEERIAQLRAEISQALERLDDEAAFETALQHLDRGPDGEA